MKTILEICPQWEKTGSAIINAADKCCHVIVLKVNENKTRRRKSALLYAANQYKMFVPASAAGKTARQVQGPNISRILQFVKLRIVNSRFLEHPHYDVFINPALLSLKTISSIQLPITL